MKKLKLNKMSTINGKGICTFLPESLRRFCSPLEDWFLE